MSASQKGSIVLITPGQPSTNPRLVKEATALAERGYHVTVLYNYWAKWAGKYDEEIKTNAPSIRWIETGGNPDSAFVLYVWSRFRHKYFRFLHRLFPHSLRFAARAEIREYAALLTAAKKHRADLYVAHNLGALPVAAIASSFHKTRYAFDAEDFHFGQRINSPKESHRVRVLENAFLPGAAYITAASPLIAEQYERMYSKKPVIINNVFPTNGNPAKLQKPNDPIKLFWFSQTIGKGRGLEDVFDALSVLPADNFSLHLLGNIDDKMRSYFRQLASLDHSRSIDVSFLDPVHPDEIVTVAESCDIGLALEPGQDPNNAYALSNKIFTYLVAGNAIIFSATPAQKQFYDKHLPVGSIYTPGDTMTLAKILEDYAKNPGTLMSQRKASKLLAEECLNWSNEKEVFLSLVAKATGS